MKRIARPPAKVLRNEVAMIARCPACQARLRLDAKRLGGKRLTLRCARCGETFQLVVPACGLCPPVLIVHGDRQEGAAIAATLARGGFQSHLCNDGRDALKVLAERPVALAVIDVALSGLLAFELLAEIRQRPALRQLRTVLLSTAYNESAYKRPPTSLYGADDYLERPALEDQLVPKLRRLLTAVSALSNEDQGVRPTTAAANPERDRKGLLP